MKPGPSRTYIRLLQGRITSERYAGTPTARQATALARTYEEGDE